MHPRTGREMRATPWTKPFVDQQFLSRRRYYPRCTFFFFDEVRWMVYVLKKGVETYRNNWDG
jgi:hypothetical protein